jgi:O-antigen ligase
VGYGQPKEKAMITAREGIVFLASFAFLVMFFRNPILGVAGFGLWGIIQFMNPVNAFFFYLLCYPFTFLEQFNLGGIRVDNIFVVVISSLALLKVAITEGQNELPMVIRSRRVGRNIILMMLFSLGVFLSLLSVGETLTLWVKSVGSVLSFIIPILLIRNERDFLSAITFLKIAAFVLAVSAILCSFKMMQFEYFTPKVNYRSPVEETLGSTGLMDSRGGFGAYMAMVLPFVFLSLSSFFEERKKTLLKHGIPFLVNLLLLMVILISIVLSGSRATWLMAITVTGLYIAFYMASRIGLKNTVILGITLGVILGITFSDVLENVIKFVNSFAPGSLPERLENDWAAILTIIKHPIFGIGHEKIFFISDTYMVVHNLFLSIGAEHGLISLVPVFLIFLFTFRMLVDTVRRASAKDRKIGFCLIIAFIGMLVNLMFYAGGEKHIWLNLGLMNIFFFLQWDKRRRMSRIARNTTSNGFSSWPRLKP